MVFRVCVTLLAVLLLYSSGSCQPSDTIRNETIPYVPVSGGGIVIDSIQTGHDSLRAVVAAIDTSAKPHPEPAVQGDAVPGAQTGRPANQIAIPPSGGVKADTRPVNPKRVQLLLPSLRRNAKPVYVGGAVFAGGLLLDYGFLRPKAASLEENDVGDLFALINPSLLATFMKEIGVLMICKQTTKAAQSYTTFIRRPPPRNYTWYLYYAGIGMAVAAQVVNAKGVLNQNEDLIAAARYMSVGIDLFYVGTGVYAHYYFKRLERDARARLSANAISIIPIVDRDRAGLVLAATF